MKRSTKWTFGFCGMAAAAMLSLAASAQQPSPARGQLQTKSTYVRLQGSANALLIEPVTLDPVRSRIAVLITHPEHANNFNSFAGQTLAKYGYRALMVNYYGDEQTYEEFLPPIAAGIKALRATPGVEKIILVGHSTGGPELSFYQDVAENGPKACQEPVRVYKCKTAGLENLPKADGLVALDANSGAPDRTIAFNPAVDPHRLGKPDPALDMFDPRNGFDPKTTGAKYSDAFKKKFFAAQAARVNSLIDEAQARLAKIEAGQGMLKDDEPFIVTGSSRGADGARLDLADTTLMGHTRAAHPLLKTDGTIKVQVIPQMMDPSAEPDHEGRLENTVMPGTVRHFLSFYAQRASADYAVTETGINGIAWRGVANSIQGNVEGIRAPTLVIASTCYDHLVTGEITFDHSAAKDKEFIGIEGADHGMRPCRPQYGDTYTRTFDYLDGWLTKPGRF